MVRWCWVISILCSGYALLTLPMETFSNDNSIQGAVSAIKSMAFAIVPFIIAMGVTKLAEAVKKARLSEK